MILRRIAWAGFLAALAAGCGEQVRPAAMKPRGSACELEFDLPSGWAMAGTPADSAGTCAFTLRIADAAVRNTTSILEAYTIDVGVTQAPFDSAARESGFERRDNGWIVHGRMGMESEAAEFAGQGWRGVRGVPAIGCTRRADSTYGGLCDVQRAVIANDRRAATLEGGPQSDVAFDALLKTLRFSPAGPAR